MTSHLHLPSSERELSPREVEIVRLIALGFTSAEIAVKLHVSRRTIETHRARIFAKLRLKTRAELVRFALDRHLLATPRGVRHAHGDSQNAPRSS